MARKFEILKIIIHFLLILVCVCSTAAFSQEQNPVGLILKINGVLEIRESAAGDWKEAKQKDPLFNGNQLRTQTGDKTMIIYSATGTRVLVNENTEIEISVEVPAAGQKPQVERTKLVLGEIYSRVSKGNYEVETPSSVASVRGTEFNAGFTEGEASYLGVEGIITVMNDFGSVIIEQLQRTTVAVNQAPSEPETITQDEAEKATAWTGEVEPPWRLNIIPEGGTEQDTGGAFTLSIMALDAKEGSIDPTATFNLTEFSADSEIIEFSVDNGKSWSGEAPTVMLINGQVQVTCRISDNGTVNVTASAEDAETAIISIIARQAKEKNTIILIFTNPDGTDEKTLIWELEEK